MWQLPAIVSDMRKRKLAAASETSLFAGIPAMLSDLQRLGIKTAIVSSDSEASVRQVLGPATSLITCFDCGAAIFGKHWKFRRVARRLGTEPADTICIGDEIRDIEASNGRMIRRGSWGYSSCRLQAGGRESVHSIDEIRSAHHDEITCECPLDSPPLPVYHRGHRTRCSCRSGCDDTNSVTVRNRSIDTRLRHRCHTQRDMWREMRVGHRLNPSRHRGAEMSELLQPTQSFLSIRTNG